MCASDEPALRGSAAEAAQEALEQHLRLQLGSWPPPAPLTVATSPRRTLPGWDGRVRPFAALASPLGTVISVPADRFDAVARIAGRFDTPGFDAALAEALEPGAAVGHPRHLDLTGVFRWCSAPTGIPDTGEWVAPDDARVPPWLRPFNGGVLCAFDDAGDYIGGVGVKRHDEFAEEIAVGTEPAARGRGIARALVATAARAIARRGAVATYVHEPANHASAHVADAAGLPDRGWRLGGFWAARVG